jgi:anti-sigma factor RsiW
VTNDEHTHIAFARLVALADEPMPDEERRRIERHLALCPRCAADASWARRIGGLIRRGNLETPPAEATARARALFRAWRTPPARQINAQLRYDSAVSGRVAGLRTGQARDRQLIYNAGAFDLDMRITALDGGWQVAGQVLGPDTAGFVEVSGAGGSARVALSELCEFTLPPLADGSYTLTLRLGELEVGAVELMLPA